MPKRRNSRSPNRYVWLLHTPQPLKKRLPPPSTMMELMEQLGGWNPSNGPINTTGMNYVEQFAHKCDKYSSRYNNLDSPSYSPDNLTGKPNAYPRYGDFPDTYIMRYYGEWRKTSASAPPLYMPHDVDPVGAEDFVELTYEVPVIPRRVVIYETFNPGAIVRILVRRPRGLWKVVYECLPEDPETIAPNSSRLLTREILYVNELVSEVRIEFNQSRLNYYTAIDAVLLCGYLPKTVREYISMRGIESVMGTPFKRRCTLAELLPVDDAMALPALPAPPAVEIIELNDDEEEVNAVPAENQFEKLPNELVFEVLKRLDLRSLMNMAGVCRRFNDITRDAALYERLSFKRYWQTANNDMFKHLYDRAKRVKMLDVSWCGADERITYRTFRRFVLQNIKTLTHLNVSQCDFFNEMACVAVSQLVNLRDLRMRYSQVPYLGSRMPFKALARLTHLEALDVCGTTICYSSLVAILRANPNMKHLIIDYCYHLENMNAVFTAIGEHATNLETFSCWRPTNATAAGIAALERCTRLRELDLGWALMLGPTHDCLMRIARGCPELRRLVICNWRSVTDADISEITDCCPELRYFDMMGMRNVSPEVVGRALANLVHLELLDVSFCQKIPAATVLRWGAEYPHINFIQANNQP